MKGTIIGAKILQNKAKLEQIEAKPGYYKWWAKIGELEIILKALNVKLKDVESAIEKKDDLYCIYVGIAAKESIRDRLNWHINQKHAWSAVKSGSLSTLRQSISSVVAKNQRAEDETNSFIDKLEVEYYLKNDGEIKNKNTEKELLDIEKALMEKNLYILNIKDNKHQIAPRTATPLGNLRKYSWYKAIEDFFEEEKEKFREFQ